MKEKGWLEGNKERSWLVQSGAMFLWNVAWVGGAEIVSSYQGPNARRRSSAAGYM